MDKQSMYMGKKLSEMTKEEVDVSFNGVLGADGGDVLAGAALFEVVHVDTVGDVGDDVVDIPIVS